MYFVHITIIMIYILLFRELYLFCVRILFTLEIKYTKLMIKLLTSKTEVFGHYALIHHASFKMSL